MNQRGKFGFTKESDDVFYKKLDEFYNYLIINNEFPSNSRGDCFSDGTKMSNWLNSNRYKLEQLAEENHMAKAILSIRQKNSNDQAIKDQSLTDKINELYRYIISSYMNKIDESYQRRPKKGIEYIYVYKIKFSDGIEMYPWLKKNYKSIYDQKEKNGKALVIIKELEKTDPSIIEKTIRRKKHYFTLSLNFNRKALEVYKYCATRSHIPSSTCKYKLYNGANMKYWIDSNKKKIWKSRFRNPYCLKLVKEILKIDKEFFNNISDEENNSKINDRKVSKRYKLLIK